jgi:hypothetical protein
MAHGGEADDDSGWVQDGRGRPEMSASSQGPGWWEASDGRWYAPGRHPNYRPPPPPDPPAQTQPTTTAPPPVIFQKPAKKKSRVKWGRVIIATAVFVAIVILITSATGSNGANVTGKVTSVGVLDGNTIRVYIVWTNNGTGSGSASCVLNTTVYNQFGDEVNIHVNSTATNGDIKPGATQFLYQDIGVDNGDAQYVTKKDLTLGHC